MNKHYDKKQQGLTIVEVLIAITLSVMLLTGVIKIFSSTSQSYRVLDGLSRIQENGRFGVEMIARDIQMGGFYGCNDGSSFTNYLNSNATLDYQFTHPVSGFNNVATTTPATLNNAGITPDAGTDVIVIRRTEGEPFRLASPTTNSNVVMEATSVIANSCADSSAMINGFCPGDIMMIADCKKSIIFQSGSLTASGTGTAQIATITHPTAGTPGNSTASWGGDNITTQFTSDANSVVYQMTTIVYFIQTVGGVPTLFKYQDGTSAALIDGVQDMQIQYGEDTTGNGIADVYLDAFGINATNANRTRWNRIVATRINLLIRSINNNLTEQALNYTFNGNPVTTTTGDSFIRREFATTVTLRNHAS